MATPILSVVMPVHRPGRWLADALDSLPDDARGAVEVVIRDSTPEGPCLESIARHAERLAIDYRHLPDMPSWTAKTNLGVATARAPHICTLHQDDLWLPGRLAAFRDAVARSPDAAMYLWPSRIIDGAGRDLGTWRLPFDAGPVDPETLRDALLVQNSIAIPAPVMRRDAYLAVGGLDDSLWYTPDWDLWLKLAQHGTAIHDARPVAAFRIHGGSQTMTGDRAEFAEQMDTVLARHMPAASREAAICRASVRVNRLLAHAVSGHPSSAIKALATIAALGPRQARRYLHASRLVERVLPRLRARFSGSF